MRPDACQPMYFPIVVYLAALETLGVLENLLAGALSGALSALAVVKRIVAQTDAVLGYEHAEIHPDAQRLSIR